MKPPEPEKELQKKESLDSEDLDVTCDSGCHVAYHLHSHFKKVKKFFSKIFQKLKMLLL